jgi:hypothetical protein
MAVKEEEWIPDAGSRPRGSKDKRVRVILERDREAMEEPVYDSKWNPMSPEGWVAETTRFSITGEPFDVAFYKIVRK